MGQLNKEESYTNKLTHQKNSDELPAVSSNYTFQVRSPVGVFFIAILENESNNPIGIHVTVGKAGSEIAAWCDAFSRLVTRALMNGLMTIHDVLQEVISIRGDKSIRDNKIKVSSGPEAVAVAIWRYQTIRSLNTLNVAFRRPATLDYGED